MRYIQFLSSWTGSGASSEDAQRCAALDLWRANGVRWQNLRDMGQVNVTPAPNVCVWEAWVEDAGVMLLENDTATEILVDEEVGGALRVWAANKKGKSDKPKKADKIRIENALKAKGVKAADAIALSKNSDGNATRQQIADAIITYCNSLPKRNR